MKYSSRIHSWGGLGSQLFAVALAYDLKKRFSNRKIEIAVHSAGVTRRDCEIEIFRSIFQIKQIDDFEPSYFEVNMIKVNSKNFFLMKEILSNIFKKMSKIMLYQCGFLNSANSDEEFSTIKSWVRTFRGHYSGRTVSSHSIDSMKEILLSDCELGNTKTCFESIGIHYRLGDLLTLTQKRPIVFEAINKTIIAIVANFKINSITFYSEQIVDNELLSSLNLNIPITSKVIDSIDVLSLSRKHRHIVGTNSKLSLWMTFFSNPTENYVYLPINFKYLFDHNIQFSNRIEFYDSQNNQEDSLK